MHTISTQPFPIGTAVIAPFWSDVDTRGTGNISFYQVTGGSNVFPAVVAAVANDIQLSFPDFSDFVPNLVFIATWDGVGSYNRNTNLVATLTQ